MMAFTIMTAIMVLAGVFGTSIYTLFTLDVPEEVVIVMHLFIATTGAAIIASIALMFQMFQSRKDKVEVLGAIKGMERRLKKLNTKQEKRYKALLGAIKGMERRLKKLNTKQEKRYKALLGALASMDGTSKETNAKFDRLPPVKDE